MSVTNNFQVKNGISVNGQQVIDSNANGIFNTITANSINIVGAADFVYDLDDISYYTDGIINTFKLTYNTSNVAVSSPFNLMVTLNGIIQPAFDYKYDLFWFSNILTASKGYCIDNVGNPTSNGYIKFADSPQAGSQVLIRTVPNNPHPKIKTYPFKPLDIVMGY